MEITPDETDYLCAAASAYFAAPVVPADVVWSFSGVRPLIDDGASKAHEATRDYLLRSENDGAPRITVFGGTYPARIWSALARCGCFIRSMTSIS